jgi:hypothetical protein
VTTSTLWWNNPSSRLTAVDWSGKKRPHSSKGQCDGREWGASGALVIGCKGVPWPVRCLGFTATALARGPLMDASVRGEGLVWPPVSTYLATSRDLSGHKWGLFVATDTKCPTVSAKGPVSLGINSPRSELVAVW